MLERVFGRVNGRVNDCKRRSYRGDCLEGAALDHQLRDSGRADGRAGDWVSKARANLNGSERAINTWAMLMG